MDSSPSRTSSAEKSKRTPPVTESMSASQAMIHDQEVRTLTLVEVTQVVSALSTGLFALTYVSGYLTATSFLGTFDVPADASEFFRAKYLYTGFNFWLFVAVFGVLFYLGSSIMNAFKTVAPKRLDEKRVLSILRFRNRYPRKAGQPWRTARWAVVMTLITSVFALEIMLMRPGTFRQFLPLQALFLLSVSLYQATFYKEYSSDSYSWGLLHGRMLVRWVRYVFSIIAPVAFAALMILEALRPHLFALAFSDSSTSWLLTFYSRVDEFRGSPRFWYWADLFIVLIFLVGCFVTLGTHHLCWADDLIAGRRVGRTNRAKNWRRAAFGALAGIGGPLLFLVIANLNFGRVYDWARGMHGYARYLFFVPVYALSLLLVLWLLSQGALVLAKVTARWNDSDILFRYCARIVFALFGWVFVAATIHRALIAFFFRNERSEHDPAKRIMSRLYDTVGFAGLTSGYCYYAFWVIHHNDNRPPTRTASLIFGYLTLMCALTVLTNMLWLTWMAHVRDTEFRSRTRTQWRRGMTGRRPGAARWQTTLRLIVPTTVLYLVSVLSFAHLVYPFIPIDKAGGDYASSRPVRLVLRDPSSECSSGDLLNSIKSTSEFYILEGNSELVYLAPSTSAGGPKCWRLGSFCGSGKSFRPKVFQLSRACVAAMESIEPKEDEAASVSSPSFRR